MADEPLEAAFGSPDEDPDRAHKYWINLALSLGYNELAKRGKELGDKVYFRLLRDQATRTFIEYGGKASLYAPDSEALVEITIDQASPTIIFRERDIELMRAAVAKWDESQHKGDTDG